MDDDQAMTERPDGFNHQTLEAIRLMAVERVRGGRATILGGDFVRLSSHDDPQMAQGGITTRSGTESVAC
jgi:hypothetical protein